MEEALPGHFSLRTGGQNGACSLDLGLLRCLCPPKQVDKAFLQVGSSDWNMTLEAVIIRGGSWRLLRRGPKTGICGQPASVIPRMEPVLQARPAMSCLQFGGSAVFTCLSDRDVRQCSTRSSCLGTIRVLSGLRSSYPQSSLRVFTLTSGRT